MSTAILRKITRAVFCLAFLTPLLVFPAHLVFPFIVSKALFFRSIIVLVGILTLVLWLYERKAKSNQVGVNFFTPLSVVLLVYFLVLFLSSIFGVDRHSSFWNTQERMVGLFTVAHYFILFFVSRYLFRSWQEWIKPLMVFLSVGILVALVGIVQKVSPQAFFNMGAPRVLSTLGNPIYLGGFALFMIFIGGLIFIKEKGWWRWLSLSASVLGLVSLYNSDTRGSYLGLIFGAVCVAIGYIFFLRGNKKVRNLFFILSLVFICLGSFAFVFRQTNCVRSIPLIGSIVNISPFEGSAKTRLMAWQIAIQGFWDKPLLGWGMNNYRYVFDKFFNTEFLNYSFQETWFDNAHNVFFNVLAEAGILGALCYLGIFGVSGWMLYQIWRRYPDQKILFIGSSAFLLAHFIHISFVFEDLTSYLYLFLFLSLVDALWREPVTPQSFSGMKKVSASALILALVFSGLIIFATNVNVVMANNQDYNMRGFMLVVGNYDVGLSHYQEAQKWYSPHQDDIDWDFAALTLDVLPNLYAKDQNKARVFYDLAEKAIIDYAAMHPLDVRARLVYIDILRGGIVLFDLDNYKKVEEQFSEAEKLAPNRQQIGYSRITYLGGTGKMLEAIKLAQTMVDKYPQVAEGYYTLAKVYSYARLWPYVLPVIDKALHLQVSFFDPTHLEFIAQAYESEGRFHDALFWWNELYKVTKDPAIAAKRDELSGLTALPISKNIEEFFKYRTTTFDDFKNFDLLK